jgi:hypothetical protein
MGRDTGISTGRGFSSIVVPSSVVIRVDGIRMVEPSTNV